MLRAYGAKGNFDETVAAAAVAVSTRPSSPLPTLPDAAASPEDVEATTAPKTPAGASCSRPTARAALALHNIPLGSGTVKVQGSGIPRTTRSGSPAARCPSTRGQLHGGGDPADRRAHGRGRRARRRGQRLAVPARPRARAQRLVLRRHRRPHAVGEPHERPGRFAAGRKRALRPRFLAGRPAGVLRERQVQ